MLERIEAYYDAVPRSAARVEEVGPFTLFMGTGAWSYYARPRLGTSEHTFTVAEIEAAAARRRELGAPETFEWVHETTPSLLGAARAAGLDVLEAPLMVLREPQPGEPPPGVTVRMIDADDPVLEAACAAQSIGFGGDGSVDSLDFLRERMRRGLTRTAIAESADGVLAAGQHQPVDDVTEIVGVATVPSARRRGIGGAITGALVADAGPITVFLSAGDAATARVYARLGFVRVATACIVG